jgi:hypothetical protein
MPTTCHRNLELAIAAVSSLCSIAVLLYNRGSVQDQEVRKIHQTHHCVQSLQTDLLAAEGEQLVNKLVLN